AVGPVVAGVRAGAFAEARPRGGIAGAATGAGRAGPEAGRAGGAVAGGRRPRRPRGALPRRGLAAQPRRRLHAGRGRRDLRRPGAGAALGGQARRELLRRGRGGMTLRAAGTPKLLGTYRTPRFEYGDVVTCARRGDVRIVGLSEAPIPWPIG